MNSMMKVRLWSLVCKPCCFPSRNEPCCIPSFAEAVVVSYVKRLTKQRLALTICGYNAISRFLRALGVAEMKDVEVGKAKSQFGVDEDYRPGEI